MYKLKIGFRLIIFSFLLMILFFPAGSKAADMMLMGENAAINGFVKDKDSKETLIGASVYIEGTKLGAFTNKSGFFSVSSVPPGEYNISVTFVGYKKFSKKIKFSKRMVVRQDFYLEMSSVMKNEINVTAEREVEKRQISISKVNIPIDQIKEIRIGGESDVFRTLQMLPGVLTSSQISSGLYVRGGSPDQNLVLLDGSTVYNPSHLFGFISAFNTDAIKDVELIKGGFPAEYGGRLSAVLNITQKDGNTEEYHGTGSIGLLSSRLSLEGPIGYGSFFVGGRASYLDLLTSALPQDPESPFPIFGFYDFNLKVNQNLTADDKVFASGFLSRDYLDFKGTGVDFKMTVGNRTASLKWTHVEGSDLFATVNATGSYYYNELKGDNSGYNVLVSNSITDGTIRGSLEWFTSESVTHKFGFESSWLEFNYLQNFSGNTDSTKSGSSAGTLNLNVHDWNEYVYGQGNYMLSELMSLQAGIRVGYWTLSKKFTFDPRVALRYQFTEDVALKASWGIYHQSLRLASIPDFSFFDTWLPTDTTVGISQSNHYILSLETHPWDGWDLNVDTYYKTLLNINEVNQTSLTGDEVKDVFYVGDGYSYGAEIFLQKKFGRLTGWIGYGLGFIKAKFNEINHGQEFRPKYDRTHDLKIVAMYKLNDSWEFGGSFTFQTGQSYTGATSRLQSLMPGENNGYGKIIQSQRYGLRLPPSHQLNLNINYLFKTFGEDSRLILDLYNVYNHRDIWFRFYDTSKETTEVTDVLLLPIIPTLSYEIKF